MCKGIIKFFTTTVQSANQNFTSCCCSLGWNSFNFFGQHIFQLTKGKQKQEKTN